jgi:hypothetical protein
LKEEGVKNLTDLERKYPRSWLAVIVKERDINGQPSKVTVIAKDMDLYKIRNQIKVDDCCIIYTGPIPEDKVVLML